MLLYIDVDGVMVPASSWRKLEILEDGFPEFSSAAVKSLDKIISKSGAEIVLTTSHKFKYSLKEWINIFNRRNINIKKITRLPENVHHLDRKQELLNWLNTNKQGADFIILDDDKSLNALPSILKSKLIQTSASVGQTDHLANEAIEMIEKLKCESV